ncbi:MAG TPA: hypothetical protein VGK19_24115 [Capsulimonadaceae bacterium]|jgi:hypothetical protein
MIARLLRKLPEVVPNYNRDSLAAYFGVPSALLTQQGSSGPLVFHQGGAILPIARALRGTIFWPFDRSVVRGLQHILPTSDHTLEAAAMHNDAAMIALVRDGEAVVETKEPGITVRLYAGNGRAHFATHNTHDGRDWLVGAGIDNVRELGIDVGSQARRICDSSYKKAYRLANLGYTLVFALLLPERDTFVAADKPDLVLTDVIDPDYEFVDRLEKERIAEDHGLTVVAQHGVMTGIANASAYFGRMRALELTAVQDDGPGYIVKGHTSGGERLSARAEPPQSRAWNQLFTEGELKAVRDGVVQDFDGIYLSDAFLEELMLDYLGSHRRSVRWQVADWLSNR